MAALRALSTAACILAGLAACSAAPPSSSSPPDLSALHRTTVLVEHDKGHGSGLIIGKNRVLTAYHVVQGEGLDIRFFDGEKVDGRVVWADPARDLALIDVAVPAGLPAARLSCKRPQPGQHVVSIGHPIQSQWVVVGGYLPVGGLVAGRYVSLGFPVGLGTSGGPVFGEDGSLIGITLAILAERSTTNAAYDEFKDTGIGLMLPASDFCQSLTG
jgi:S1-C subfamily serine protease